MNTFSDKIEDKNFLYRNYFILYDTPKVSKTDERAVKRVLKILAKNYFLIHFKQNIPDNLKIEYSKNLVDYDCATAIHIFISHKDFDVHKNIKLKIYK